MNDFTPDTEQVRSHYVFNQRDEWDAERGDAFDRWLAEVQADEAQAIVNLIAGIAPSGAGMDPITDEMYAYIEGVRDAWSAVNARAAEYREKGENSHE